MTDILTQFEGLLKAGKIEEAKAMLGKLAERELTPDEEAEAKVLQTRLSIKLTNAINKAYLETLDESIEKLKSLNRIGRAFDEKVKLAEARSARAQ